MIFDPHVLVFALLCNLLSYTIFVFQSCICFSFPLFVAPNWTPSSSVNGWLAAFLPSVPWLWECVYADCVVTKVYSGEFVPGQGSYENGSLWQGTLCYLLRGLLNWQTFVRSYVGRYCIIGFQSVCSVWIALVISFCVSIIGLVVKFSWFLAW